MRSRSQIRLSNGESRVRRAGCQVVETCRRRRRARTRCPSAPRRWPGRAPLAHQLGSRSSQVGVAVAGEVPVDLGRRWPRRGPARRDTAARRTTSASVSSSLGHTGRQAALAQVPPADAAVAPGHQHLAGVGEHLEQDRHRLVVGPPAAGPRAHRQTGRGPACAAGRGRRGWRAARRARRRWSPASRGAARCAPSRPWSKACRIRYRWMGRSDVGTSDAAWAQYSNSWWSTSCSRRSVVGLKRPTRLQVTSSWVRATTEMGSICRHPRSRTRPSRLARSRPTRGPDSRWPR